MQGCLSFGLAVSDFVFGEEAPVTQHRNFRSLAVGDVIHIRGGEAERVLILTAVDREEDAYAACSLEKNGKVEWDEWGPLSGLVDAAGFTTVYSRAGRRRLPARCFYWAAETPPCSKSVCATTFLSSS